MEKMRDKVKILLFFGVCFALLTFNQLLGLEKTTERSKNPTNYLIIGEKRSGTTSLYHYLSFHPNLRHSIDSFLDKDNNNIKNNQGESNGVGSEECCLERILRTFTSVDRVYWQASCFDSHLDMRKVEEKERDNKVLTQVRDRQEDFELQENEKTERKKDQIAHEHVVRGESCVNFLSSGPEFASRVYQLDPTVKLVVLIRDPVQRLLAQYNHNAFLKQTHSEYELSEIVEKLLDGYEHNDPNVYETWDGLLSRGFYQKHLDDWTKVFPRKQLLILQTEKLYTHAQETVSKVFKFLGVDEFTLTREHLKLYNSGFSRKKEYSVLEAATEMRLQELYESESSDIDFD